MNIEGFPPFILGTATVYFKNIQNDLKETSIGNHKDPVYTMLYAVAV